MTSKKKVENCFCEYCGEKLEYVWTKSNKPEKQYFCNPEHSNLWRKENGMFHKMSEAGKSGREAAVPKLKEAGHYKRMSEAGKAGRSRVMPISNRKNPRRRKIIDL